MSVPRTRAFAPSDTNHAFHVFVIPITLCYSTSALTRENHGLCAAPELERSECVHLLIYPLPKKGSEISFCYNILEMFFFCFSLTIIATSLVKNAIFPTFTY